MKNYGFKIAKEKYSIEKMINKIENTFEELMK